MAKIKTTAVFPIIVAVILSLNAKAETTKSEGGHWVSAWSDAVHTPLPFPDLPASPVIENQTIRMVVRPTLGGERLRIRFSNGFGTTAIAISAAHIALLSKGAQIIPESDRVLTFSGKASVTIPPGAPMLSDPVGFEGAGLCRGGDQHLLARKDSSVIHSFLGAARNLYFRAGGLHVASGYTERHS